MAADAGALREAAGADRVVSDAPTLVVDGRAGVPETDGRARPATPA